ncbi:hypothetical protein IWQ60_004411 [Tieghemiomyces parasiticus]|uniref:Uncharacterized protein n=1 Tax=Tieghemiomyces parasiticus TaxID=78921 RepID=A0A9W8A8X4_9FUNG|nr:hypothetical protein IWQ60_004411 [Tieghemiomyces parasiticus]
MKLTLSAALLVVVLGAVSAAPTQQAAAATTVTVTASGATPAATVTTGPPTGALAPAAANVETVGKAVGASLTNVGTNVANLGQEIGNAANLFSTGIGNAIGWNGPIPYKKWQMEWNNKKIQMQNQVHQATNVFTQPIQQIKQGFNTLASQVGNAFRVPQVAVPPRR